jgi:hypothetical protein
LSILLYTVDLSEETVIKTTLLTLGMAFALSGAASAASIVNVVFVGPGTSVTDSNGVAVTPYNITIDGVPQVVTCYDLMDDIVRGDSWQAYEYTLSDAITDGMFHTGFGDPEIGYKSVGWLSAQTYSTPAEEVGLQYAIWDVFGSPQALSGDELTAYNNYETALNDEINYVDPVTHTVTPFGNFDFSHTTYLEPTTGAVGASGTKQAFVFAITPGGPNQSSTPEPGTLVMIGSGLLCLLSSLGIRRFAGKRG